MSSILAKLPSNRMYVELFSGDKTNLMRKIPTHSEVYNDQRNLIVDFFKVLRFYPNDFKEYVINNNKSIAENHKEISSERWLEIANLFYHFNNNKIEGNLKRCSGFRDLTPGLNKELQNIHADLPYMVKRLRMLQYENRPFKDIIERFDRPETVFYVDVSRLEDIELTPEELCFELLKVKGKCIIYGVNDSSRYNTLIDEGWIEVLDDETNEKCWINYRI